MPLLYLQQSLPPLEVQNGQLLNHSATDYYRAKSARLR